MSCPNTPAPKCCEPSKKPCAATAAPACSNLPNTLTFTCPADECQSKPAKPFCPEKPKENGCTSIGKDVPPPPPAAADCEVPPPAPPTASADAGCETVKTESTSGGGSGGGCSPNTSCESPPLTMDGGCNK